MAKTDASQESPEMLSHEGVYINHKWYWKHQDVGPYHHKPTQESCKHNSELLQEMETLHAPGSRDWGRLSTMSNTDAAATNARYRVAMFRVCTNSVQSCHDPAFPFSAFILFLSNGTAHSIPLNTGNTQFGFSGDHGEQTVLSFIGSLWAVLSFQRVFDGWYGKLRYLLKLKYMYFASSDGHKPGARYGTSRSMCKSPHSLICLNSYPLAGDNVLGDCEALWRRCPAGRTRSLGGPCELYSMALL